MDEAGDSFIGLIASPQTIILKWENHLLEITKIYHKTREKLPKKLTNMFELSEFSQIVQLWVKQSNYTLLIITKEVLKNRILLILY